VKKYIALKNGWFNEGLECNLITNCGSCGGIFEGIRVAQFESELHPIGEPYWDEELCPWDEFEIIDEEQ
jgi:hypothetical protein